nr:hypothetical protein [Tanacetum cinerariifolium]
VTDSQLGCLATGVVNGGQGFSRTKDAKISGTSLNQTRQQSRDTTTTCNNVDGGGCFSSKREPTETYFILAGGLPPNTESSFHMNVSTDSSHIHESVMSSYTNRKQASATNNADNHIVLYQRSVIMLLLKRTKSRRDNHCGGGDVLNQAGGTGSSRAYIENDTYL